METIWYAFAGLLVITLFALAKVISHLRVNDQKNRFEVLEGRFNHLLSEKELKVSEVTRLTTLLETEKTQMFVLQSEKAHLLSKIEEHKNEFLKTSLKYESLAGQLKENEKIIEQLKVSLMQKEKENSELAKEKVAWMTNKQKNEDQIQEKLLQLTAVYQEHKDEKDRIRKEAQEKQLEVIHQRDQEWRAHEAKVKEEFKQIASRCGVEIPLSYPFQGEPDNCVMIKGEYVIFDAKAPKNSDRPENLEKYLNEQIKKIGKYTDEKMVRKEAFLVVPDSALPFISSFYKEREGNKVYIIPLCAVEPIIRNMKLIENYELVEQLSPEDRENIVQFIGKSTYVMKKKIQIDQAFSYKFFEIIDESKNLPEEILIPALEKETTLSVSLPTDRSSKVIKESDLRTKSAMIDRMIDVHDKNMA